MAESPVASRLLVSGGQYQCFEARLASNTLVHRIGMARTHLGAAGALEIVARGAWAVGGWEGEWFDVRFFWLVVSKYYYVRTELLGNYESEFNDVRANLFGNIRYFTRNRSVAIEISAA